jgi:hypothetical protein
VIATWSRSEEQLAKLGVSPAALRAESELRAPLARRHAWELFELWWQGLAVGADPAPARLGD